MTKTSRILLYNRYRLPSLFFKRGQILAPARNEIVTQWILDKFHFMKKLAETVTQFELM